MDCFQNCINTISNTIGVFVSLVEIGCSLGSWIIFLVYLVSYSQMDITGYEYSYNYVFVLEGSGPRQKILDPDCVYVQQESIGNSLVSYLSYFKKQFLVYLGIMWLIVAGIFIIILIIYFVQECREIEINKRRKLYFNGMKLIFDIIIPLVMTPIASVQLNGNCVTGYPRLFFSSGQPKIYFFYTLTLIGIQLIGYFIAIDNRWPLYTMFYAAAKKIMKNCEYSSQLYQFLSLLLFGYMYSMFILSNPLQLIVLSLFSFVITVIKLIRECNALEREENAATYEV